MSSPSATGSVPRSHTSIVTAASAPEQVAFASWIVRSGDTFAVVPVPGEFWRELLSPGTVQFCSHIDVRGTWPESVMLVTAYACWFQIGRVLTQRSSRSPITRTPNAVAGPGFSARHTWPAGDGPAIGSRHTNPSPPQSASIVQRQRPSASPGCSLPHGAAFGQSASSLHATPSKIGSSAGHVMPAQLVFDGTTISALKSASVSAITGFSNHVHERRNREYSTRP